jgi:dTMP kinase
MPRGRFISLEGNEGCGKSTQTSFLRERLEAAGHRVVLAREPGGTPTGEMIRDLLQHHASGEDIRPRAEVMLFAASRAQLVDNVIRPALERGDWVICDRFVDSSLAYQGFGRGIGLETVLRVNEIAVAECWPDVTFWFDLPVHTALERIAGRGGRPDRFESEERAFHERVAEGYRCLASHFSERFQWVDADRPAEQIAEELWRRLEAWR